MKFREKIFIALLLTNIIALSVMAYINFRESVTTLKNDKIKQFQRANEKVRETFEYILSNNGKENLEYVLESRIYEFANVYNIEINVYSLDGKLIISDRLKDSFIDKNLLSQLVRNREIKIVKDLADGNNSEQNLYSYISTNNSPVAILHIKKILNSSNINELLSAVTKKYIGIVILLSILSGFIAWLTSKNLTKKVQDISKKLEKTDVSFLEQPIIYTDNDEITPMVNAYNNMLSKLEKQTYLLQKNEREEAWKEMAKQVAHEINNPLTPLRLTIQNFHRRFKQEDPENEEKVKKLTESVIHQIDIISSITKSFSDLAKMPAHQDTVIDVVETIRRTLDIFPPTIVSFNTNTDYLLFKMDAIYLSRIITNIVKNGIQASTSTQNKKVEVSLIDNDSDFIISIKDNGNGIPENIKERIFEKNFTTKSTGMGLGLTIVKSIIENYGGTLTFETQENIGTTFFILFKKNN